MLGDFPYYGHPDPAKINLTWMLHSIFLLTMGLPLTIIGFMYVRKEFNIKRYALFFIPIVLILVLFLTNAFNIYEWISD